LSTPQTLQMEDERSKALAAYRKGLLDTREVEAK
jgi:hypothetical protein